MGRVPACRVERVGRTNQQRVKGRRRGSRSYRYVIRDEEKELPPGCSLGPKCLGSSRLGILLQI
jgi:hypothetical protein